RTSGTPTRWRPDLEAEDGGEVGGLRGIGRRSPRGRATARARPVPAGSRSSECSTPRPWPVPPSGTRAWRPGEGGGPVRTREPAIEDLEALRVPLTGYCYRLRGSSADTDDAVQETLIRASANLDRF